MDYTQLAQAKVKYKFPPPSIELHPEEEAFYAGQKKGYIDALNDVKGLVELVQEINKGIPIYPHHSLPISSGSEFHKRIIAAIEQFEKINE